MLFLKNLLMFIGVGMILTAVGILAYDSYLILRRRTALQAGTEPVPPLSPTRWRPALALALLGWGPILLALAIVVVPSGMAGVSVSQTQGTLSGTLVSRSAFRNSAGRERCSVRHSRSTVHHGFAGAGRQDAQAKAGTVERPGQRRTDYRTGDHGSVPHRSQAPRLHPEQSASAGRKGNRASCRRQRMARTGAQLHRSRRVRQPNGKKSGVEPPT